MIEARPGSFINKGGELMMRAIVAELGEDAELVVEPWIAPYRDRARLGLHQKLRVRRLGPAADLPAAMLPAALRRRFGIIEESAIGAVLDASGFRYTDDDQNGARSARELAGNATRWHRRGIPVVLMPQALGPFRSAAVREPFLRALDRVSLVFARDPESETYMREIAPGDERIRRAPDFTISLEGRVPDDLPALVGNGSFAAIVPNDRMLERTSPEVAAHYGRFLETVVSEVVVLGLRPVLVLHETSRDMPFVERLRGAMGDDGRVVAMTDPLALKGVLGAATIVVSSRYHALISAMSQGVPVVATSWSHKYATLLDAFGCSEQLVDPRAQADIVRARLDVARDGPVRAAMVARLHDRTAGQREEVRSMWEAVRTLLDLPVRVA
ncbi:MAG TPA: polysaccharide pyruvyl transferase family protein [Methylomirabilota bacterium]|nr:polysaccharide pyruvyl transferase family protein [Methylomirabilota bacterium]